jgi:HSP20 family molecular chaperone IbpA
VLNQVGRNTSTNPLLIETEEDREGRLLVEVEIPRVEKKDVTVHMSEDRFHIILRFARGQEQRVTACCRKHSQQP